MTGAGGWVYAQALAAQSKTNELLSMSSIGSGGGSSDVSSENATEFWKNQTKLWNDAAKEWNGPRVQAKSKPASRRRGTR